MFRMTSISHVLLEQLYFIFTLFVIIDPIAVVPIFISLTEGKTAKIKERERRLAAFTMFVTLLVALYVGEKILLLIGANLDSFKVAGGIILLLLSISMIRVQFASFRTTREEREYAAHKHTSIGAVPIGIPLLAGPGSMTLTVIAGHDYSIFGKLPYILSLIVLSIVVYLCLKSSTFLAKKLGPSGINILMRIMGILVASVAVKLIADGLVSLLPGLAA